AGLHGAADGAGRTDESNLTDESDRTDRACSRRRTWGVRAACPHVCTDRADPGTSGAADLCTATARNVPSAATVRTDLCAAGHCDRLPELLGGMHHRRPVLRRLRPAPEVARGRNTAVARAFV